jgi:transcriptional regulator with XRE-family HTH domain
LIVNLHVSDRYDAEHLSNMTPMPGDAEQVGQNIRTQRERAGLSLSQLSQATGISKAHLVRLETKPANPSLELLRRIAEALNVTIADLVGGPKLTYRSAADEDVPASLKAFADSAGLKDDEVRTLASIKFRGGERPRTIKRWHYIYESLNLSQGLDRDDNEDLD